MSNVTEIIYRQQDEDVTIDFDGSLTGILVGIADIIAGSAHAYTNDLETAQQVAAYMVYNLPELITDTLENGYREDSTDTEEE